MSARYFEDFAPGHGRAAPRAALDSDAPRIDLNGDWAFPLHGAVADAAAQARHAPS
jgi:beta-galactosidase